MSELIDNRRHRIEALKTMIKELHAGAEVQALQGRFRAVLDHAGAAEISAMESELMAEGMPEQEIRRMCELHVAVFRDTLEQRPAPHTVPGHPVHTFMRENRAIVELTAATRAALAAGDLAAATAAHGRLAAVDGHYKRKEYLVFPFLEKAGIGAPPKVMWGIDDQVRELLAAGGDALANAGELGAEELALVREVVLEPMLAAVDGMVEKEDRVLWPMALEHLADADWGAVLAQWGELGAGLVEPEEGWRPSAPSVPAAVAAVAGDDAVVFPSGHLTPRQLHAMLDTLPLDVTFVDADDRVAFFTEGKERVFARNRAIVGRRVQDCHPPASMHVVQHIVDDLRSGARDVAEFWIELHGRFVHIRYFAVRDEDGAYLGCLEATQDVTAIRALTGERRLLAETPAAGEVSMLVNPETRVGPLLDAHPELEDVLIGLSPEYRRLKNPILRRTVARVATLAQVAKVGGLPVPDLVNALRVALGQAAGGCDAHAAPDEPEWPAWAETAAPVSWLDADAVLAAGGTPVGQLAGAAATAAPGTILGLCAGFYPAPLVDTLRGKGHEVAARQAGERWEIVVRVA